MAHSPVEEVSLAARRPQGPAGFSVLGHPWFLSLHLVHPNASRITSACAFDPPRSKRLAAIPARSAKCSRKSYAIGKTSGIDSAVQASSVGLSTT